MSPEQVLGEALHARSDVLAFGVILYEMLAGSHPFKRKTAAATLNAILTAPLPPLERVRRDEPETIASMLSSAARQVLMDLPAKTQRMPRTSGRHGGDPPRCARNRQQKQKEEPS